MIAAHPGEGPQLVQVFTKADLSDEARPGPAGLSLSSVTGEGLPALRRRLRRPGDGVCAAMARPDCGRFFTKATNFFHIRKDGVYFTLTFFARECRAMFVNASCSTR